MILNSVLKYFYLTVCLVSCGLSLFHDKVPCTPIGYCKCIFPNGLGVDLAQLNTTNLTVSAGPESTLMFFPCRDVQVYNSSNITLVNECSLGTSLCLKKNDTKEVKFYNLGSRSDSKFLWERLIDQPELIFSHGDKSTQILLTCEPGSKVPSLVQMKSSGLNNSYAFQLNTELACLGTVEEEGHSVFSTFMILILVCFLVYFLGGFLVLKFIRGAVGLEAIPNNEFWRNLGSSAKEGFFYMVNGCKRPEAYDTI